jgi:hypothetical protein
MTFPKAIFTEVRKATGVGSHQISKQTRVLPLIAKSQRRFALHSSKQIGIDGIQLALRSWRSWCQKSAVLSSDFYRRDRGEHGGRSKEMSSKATLHATHPRFFKK